MVKQIKVLHTEWSDGWGGQEIRILEESKALRELGVYVAIACKPNSGIAQKAKEAGFLVFELSFKSNTDFKTFFALKDIVRKHDFDIINTHSGKDTWTGGLAAKLAGIKFIRTRHLSNKINPSRLNFINELADYIITTGESVRDNMIENNRINPEKIQSIPTGIDGEIFNANTYDKADCKEIFGMDQNSLYVGNLAVLRTFKRHDIFLKIALNVHRTHPDIKFIIAGKGTERIPLEKFITDNDMSDYVTLLGHVDKTAEFLKAIDIFILTSDGCEGLPQSLMQALMMQKPCISTDVGSIRDLLNDENFLMVEFSETSLTEALLSLLNDKIMIHDLEQNSQDFIKNNFSKKVMAEKILQIYENLLSKKG